MLDDSVFIWQMAENPANFFGIERKKALQFRHYPGIIN